MHRTGAEALGDAVLTSQAAGSTPGTFLSFESLGKAAFLPMQYQLHLVDISND